MTDQTGATGGETVSDLPADAPESFSPGEAAAYFTSLVEKRNNKEQPAESAEPATAEDELSGEDNAAADENQPTGETEEADPVEKPPLELPRSWTKDRTEHWSKLDPDTQEFLLEQDRKASAEVRRLQNETAEKLKGLTAKEQAAEQARQQSEVDAKAARDVLDREQRARFPDIKSWEDYERLSNEASRLSESDPFTSLRIANYLKDFDTHQKSMQFNAQHLKQIEDQKAQERHSKRGAYEAEQNKLLIELVPDMADPKKAAVKRESAVAMLTSDLGLKMEDLQRWMQTDIGHEILSNAGIQKLMDNGLTLKAIQAAKKVVADKPVPQVQRPGVTKPQGSLASEKEQALTRNFEQNPSIANATALRLAQLRRRAS